MTRKRAKRRAPQSEYHTGHVETLRHGIPYGGADSLHARPDSCETIGHGEWADSLDGDACRAAWHILGLWMMEDHIVRYPGTRPFMFWIRERSEDMPPSPARQCIRLLQLGDLTIEEDAILRERIAARPQCLPLTLLLDGVPLDEGELDALDGPAGLWDLLSLVPVPARQTTGA
jgi:hypothetical protein